jgi:quercetin dioxygenase-like cupin family protein
MTEETLHHRGTTLVRRLSLSPGEATRWHRDPFHRVSVVFKGDVLDIEFGDGRPRERVRVTPGQVDWDEPSDRIHRAVNIGDVPYEEITVFLLNHPDDVPQPGPS